jgi:putative flippase GtrA
MASEPPREAPGHRKAVPIYLGSGFLSTGSHYAVTVAAVELFGWPPLAASVTGFLVGAVVKYLLNYFVAFRSEERHSAAVVRFAVMLALFFGLNAAFFAVFQQVLGLHYMVAQVLTTAVLIAPSYVLARGWVFGLRSRREARP